MTRTRPGRRPDTTWHADFLNLLAQGNTYRAAAQKLGIARATLYRHLLHDSAFADQARQACPRRRRGDVSWHQPFLILVAAGLSFARAAAELDIARDVRVRHFRAYPALRDRAHLVRAPGLPGPSHTPQQLPQDSP